MVLDDIWLSKSNPSAPKSSPLQLIEAAAAEPIDRMAAVVADAILFFPIMMVVVSPFARQAKEAQLLDNDGSWTFAVISALGTGLLTFILYQTLFVAVFGATPGKRLLGLRVVSLWRSGRPTPIEAFTRAVVWTIELLTLGFGFAAVFSNERRRPLHDRAGDTAVISVRAGRRGRLPGLAESAMASGFQAAFMAVLVLLGTMRLADFKKQMIDPETVATSEENEGRLCADVQAALTHGKHDPKLGGPDYVKQRLQAALALFSADEIDTDCLDAEAEFALWNRQQVPLAYLAKALSAPSDDEAGQYFEKICGETNGPSSSDVCKMVTFTRAEAEGFVSDGYQRVAKLDETSSEEKKKASEDEARLQTLAQSITAQSPTYLRVAAIRYLMAFRDYGRALDLMEGEPQILTVGAFFAKERTKALWNLGQRKEARSSLRSTATLVGSNDRVDLTRWFCSAELAATDCSGDSRSSCAWFENDVTPQSSFLSRAEVAATFIRTSECKFKEVPAAERVVRLRALEETMPITAGRTYLEALALLGEGKKSEATSKLRELASHQEHATSAFAIEANVRLAELAPDMKTLGPIVKVWQRLHAGDEGFKPLGLRLLRRMNALRAWPEAMKIGFKMTQTDPADQDFLEEMVIAADGAGQHEIATGLLENALRLRHGGDLVVPTALGSSAAVVESRTPASVPDESKNVEGEK